MIWIFSNVPFTRERAPEVAEDDLLVFLNKAVGLPLYRDHAKKVVYHRSPKNDYGVENWDCLHKYVFDAGLASIPKGFVDGLKREYDWVYPIEDGKVKCMTTGYMVTMYLHHLYPGEPITLVNSVSR